jgi:serine/threonine protein kinase
LGTAFKTTRRRFPGSVQVESSRLNVAVQTELGTIEADANGGSMVSGVSSLVTCNLIRSRGFPGFSHIDTVEVGMPSAPRQLAVNYAPYFVSGGWGAAFRTAYMKKDRPGTGTINTEQVRLNDVAWDFFTYNSVAYKFELGIGSTATVTPTASPTAIPTAGGGIVRADDVPLLQPNGVWRKDQLESSTFYDWVIGGTGDEFEAWRDVHAHALNSTANAAVGLSFSKGVDEYMSSMKLDISNFIARDNVETPLDDSFISVEDFAATVYDNLEAITEASNRVELLQLYRISLAIAPLTPEELCIFGDIEGGELCRLDRNQSVLTLALVVMFISSGFVVFTLIGYRTLVTSREKHRQLKEEIVEQHKVLSDSLRISPAEVTTDKEIGRGAMGVVFKGKWRGLKVAVKEISTPGLQVEEELGALLAEAKIMSEIRHPNVVQLFGVCLERDHLCILSELCEKGSLADILHDSSVDLSMKDKLWLAVGAANGLNYLHKTGIAHRDVKSANVLVDDKLCAKVADFGQAKFGRIASDLYGVEFDAWGSARYLPPECIQEQMDIREGHKSGISDLRLDSNKRMSIHTIPKKLSMMIRNESSTTSRGSSTTQQTGGQLRTDSLHSEIELVESLNETDVRLKDMEEQGDVYAFGIVLWEILIQRTPFDNLKFAVQVEEAVLNGIRPLWTAGTSTKPGPALSPSTTTLNDIGEQMGPEVDTLDAIALSLNLDSVERGRARGLSSASGGGTGRSRSVSRDTVAWAMGRLDRLRGISNSSVDRSTEDAQMALTMKEVTLAWISLTEQCWAHDRHLRPSMDVVVMELEKIQKLMVQRSDSISTSFDPHARSVFAYPALPVVHSLLVLFFCPRRVSFLDGFLPLISPFPYSSSSPITVTYHHHSIIITPSPRHHSHVIISTPSSPRHHHHVITTSSSQSPRHHSHHHPIVLKFRQRRVKQTRHLLRH